MNPTPVTPTTLINQLEWRYATKQFDPARSIPAADWAALEQSLVLTPSSFGLQPWQFLVITDRATRERLVPASWNQRQVADASHLVVFAIRQNVGAAEVDRHLARTAELRGIPVASLNGFRDVLLGFISRPPAEFNVNDWAARQAYIALGNFLTSAALLGIDACPLEGIEPARYDEILGLPAQGLRTVVAAAAGYRAAGDKYAALPKVRFAPAEVITRIG